jgi:hypothetical protein
LTTQREIPQKQRRRGLASARRSQKDTRLLFAVVKIAYYAKKAYNLNGAQLCKQF